MELQQKYQESINSYNVGYPQETDVLSTPDNGFLLTEDDNLIVDEEGNPLVLY